MSECLGELVDELDAIMCRADGQSDAASWAKAGCYLRGYALLRKEPQFASLRGKALTRRINEELHKVAAGRKKLLPTRAFFSHAVQLESLWPELFGVDTKFLPYDSYRLIAVCSLPAEQKKKLRERFEHEPPLQAFLRKTIRQQVDAHRGIYWPDFELKSGNFWKFSTPHDNGGYGGVHLELIANLLFWFSEPGDVVLDPMAGSGVLADTLSNYRFFREVYEAEGSGPRMVLMSDISPRRFDIVQADALKGLPFGKEAARLVIIDPPYLRVADSKSYQNIGHDLKQWLKALRLIIINSLQCLEANGLIAIISDDVLRKNEHCALGLEVQQVIKSIGLMPHVTIYNHNPNFVYSMGPAQMKAARKARMLCNGCKIIQVARKNR
jgi:hypothetical protein